MYSYDINGWYSETDIPGRQTDIAPMPAEGTKRPNFTGHKWLLQEYREPVAPTVPIDDPVARILADAELVERLRNALLGL